MQRLRLLVITLLAALPIVAGILSDRCKWRTRLVRRRAEEHSS